MVSVAATRAPVRCDQHGEHQADGALAHDEDEVLGLGIALHHRLEAGVEGFDEGGPLEGDAFGDLLHAAFHDPIHHPDVLGKPAAGGFKPGGDPDFLVHRALGVSFAVAVEAFEPQGMWWKATTRSPGRNFTTPAPHGHDHACGLMTVNPGRGQQVVLDFFEVGVADAAGFHADEESRRGRWREWGFPRR